MKEEKIIYLANKNFYSVCVLVDNKNNKLIYLNSFYWLYMQKKKKIGS